MKYKYIGTSPVLLIEYHKELQPGVVYDIDGVVDNPLLVPVEKDNKKGVSE